MRSSRWLWIAVPLACAAQAQNPPDVTFKLAAKEGRTQFVVGEAVNVELQFSAAIPGRYQAHTGGTKRAVRQPKYDHFTVEPAAGVIDPLKDIYAQKEGTVAGYPDFPAPLDASPRAFTLALNEWLSIRQAGHYRIVAETTRITRISAPDAPVPLRSNAIDIDVTEPAPGWASAQLSHALDMLTRNSEAEKAAQVVRFLETREAVPVLTRFFENGSAGGAQELHAGLFGSPYREEVIAAMEDAIADPDFAVTYYYLATLTELQSLTVLGPTPLFTAETPQEIKRWIDEVERPRDEVMRRLDAEGFARLGRAIGNKRGRALTISEETMARQATSLPVRR
jgi:hypothetical protein